MSELENRPLVKAEHLKKYFKTPRGTLHAVDDVSFSVAPGETLGLVGESGCGKSTVGNVIMRLLTPTEGTATIEGKSIYEKGNAREICHKMQIIFQDPYYSLNPRKTIRQILSEPYLVNKVCKGEELEKRLKELCRSIGLNENLLDHYPHELDGGMRQVVGIGRALALDPKFIVCDEPVSALDVSVQAKIINMLMDLQKERNLSYLFISHDLSVVRHISNRIAVMYLGQIVELAPADEIFENAMHPYAIALLSAVPKVSIDKKVSRIVLKGDVPSPIEPKPVCRFAPRCWMACEKCHCEEPPMVEYAPGHFVKCFRAEESRQLMGQAEKSQIENMDF